MKVNKLNDWLQLTAAAGVLIGLLLVAYELRQEHELVRAQLGAETFESQLNVADALRDDATANAYAKALESPETMTVPDQVILHGFFTAVINAHLQQFNYLTNRGIFPDGRLKRPVDRAVFYIFSSSYGRAWWADNRMTYGEGLRDLMDAAAARNTDHNFLDRAAGIKEEAIRESAK